MNDDGVVFYPSRYDPPIGHAGFEARLRDEPTPRYFDACRMSLPMEEAGELRRLTVAHPWNHAPDVRFAAGRIRLDASDGDHQEVFGLGGVATIITSGDTTVCRVTSEAPLMPLSDDPNDPQAVLESELEVLLARSRARWGGDEHAHLDRLGHIPPLTLFAAFLGELEGRLPALAGLEGDVRVALRYARTVREALQHAGDWPTPVPRWEDLI